MKRKLRPKTNIFANQNKACVQIRDYGIECRMIAVPLWRSVDLVDKGRHAVSKTEGIPVMC